MQYPFREFVREVDVAITNAALTSVWGSISGDVTTQSDLISGGKFLNSLVGESNVTQHEAALSIATSQLTGSLPDARVAESNVTQHEAALSIDGSQVTSTVRDESGSPYTFVLSDANKVIRFTSASAIVGLSPDATTNFPIGTTITFRQAGTGTLAFASGGVTINGTLPSWAQHVEVTLRKVGADEWDVV